MPDNPVPLSEQIAALRRAVHERAGLAAYSGMAADPHLSALHAALVTLEAQQWRPIETAPKDGTEFLALWQAPGATAPKVIVAKWNAERPFIGFYGVNVQDGLGRQTISPLEWGMPERLCATHWRPLPSPPEPSDA